MLTVVEQDASEIGSRSGISKHSPSGVSYHIFTLVLIIVVLLALSPLLSAPTRVSCFESPT